MTARERLYELVEDLNQEAVERLIARWDEVLFMASDWEPDDRPLTPDEEAAVREGSPTSQLGARSRSTS